MIRTKELSHGWEVIHFFNCMWSRQPADGRPHSASSSSTKSNDQVFFNSRMRQSRSRRGFFTNTIRRATVIGSDWGDHSHQLAQLSIMESDQARSGRCLRLTCLASNFLGSRCYRKGCSKSGIIDALWETASSRRALTRADTLGTSPSGSN